MSLNIHDKDTVLKLRSTLIMYIRELKLSIL